MLAAAIVTSLAVIANPAAIASAAAPVKLAPPPNTIHHTKIVGHIVPSHATRGYTCTGSSPSEPSPSADSLAYLAESSTNEVQVVDEATGALVGSPITVGTAPQGAAYWQPATSGARDARVVVSNSGSHSVTVIEAQSQTVEATISLPSGSGATAVAASPTQPFAIVVDHDSGNVSVINLTDNTDAGQISLTSTADALDGVAFASSGDYAYVTDPSEHEIFVLGQDPTSPYFFLQQTYSTGSDDPAGIATDLSSNSSSGLFVTDDRSSGHLLEYSDSVGTLSSPTVVKALTSPTTVAVSPGAATAYVQLSGTKTFDEVTVSSGSTTTVTPNSGFGNLSTIALSADGSTVLSADSSSGDVQGTDTSSNSATNETAADAEVYAIAPAPPVLDSWDAYVTIPGENVIDVVNAGSGTQFASISDTHGPVAVAPSPDGKYVYVANASSVTVIQTSLVGTTANPVVATITGIQGSEPNTPSLQSIAVSPSGDAVVVTDTANGAAYVIDTNSADGSSYRTVVNRIGLLGGSGSTTVTPAGGIAFSADGLEAYVTEKGVSSRSYDGVTVLSLASATTTGYSYDATDEALTQDGATMILPDGIAADPNGESVYVVGTQSGSSTWGLYTFPVQSNGQVANSSSSTGPVSTGVAGGGVAYSPEDQSAFVTDTGSDAVSSVSQQDDDVAWSSSVSGLGGNVAVSQDGLYVGTMTTVDFCDHGYDGIEIFDAGSGTELSDVVLGGVSASSAIAFAPQSSPKAVASVELAGGATNPAESAVTSGMNDIVSSGTPSDAPGASAGVDTATGAYSLSIDSMTIPDLGPSLDQTATYDSSRASIRDLLGYGWDSTYELTASQNTTTCVVTVTFADGATTTFQPTTSSGSCSSRTYQPAAWAQAKLTFASSCNGSDSCFVINVDASTKYYVDETTGQLVKFSDLNGNTVTITWGSHTACAGATSTEPCQVTAADGIRTLTFSYPSPGSGTCPSADASCVVVTDPLGRTLTYGLNSSGELVGISLSNGTETASYALTYNSAKELTGWWDPNNEANDAGNTSFATDVTYDTAGQVTEVTGPEIYSVAPLSTTPITPTTTIAYEDFDAAKGTGTVLVQNPDFNQSITEAGASQTLDTYSEFELVSSVVGYGSVGSYTSGTTAPVVPINPSESATPLRDAYNLQPSESMNALAGTTEAAVGTQDAQYDNGITETTYDAYGNVLSTTDESGNTTTTTYDSLNLPVTSTDALGNVTSNTYNSTGQVLTTTSPPTNAGGTSPETSNYYNANGTLCASRDADQTATYGALTSCVSAGSNATTYTYDSSGDTSLTTVTDSSTQTSTTQDEYDADGNTCATLSPDGYAITGDRLSSCPTSGAPYATVTASRDVYGNQTKSISSLSVAGTNTYATTNTCTDQNGNTTATVGPMGTFSSCGSLSPTSSVDASFTTFDPEGDTVQSIQPLASSGTQGPTSTSQFDADQADVLDLSADGYVVWAANHSATLTPFETGVLTDSQGNQVASAPEPDLTSTCQSDVSTTAPGSVPSSLCPDTSLTAYDSQGQQTEQASSSNGDGGSTALTTASTTNNPTGTDGGDLSQVGGGTSGVAETAQQSYDANGNSLGTVNEHWTGSSWVADSSASTAYAPDGSTCWTSPSTVSSPSCTSPPTGTATVDFYDANGNVLAEVGPGGSGVIGTSGHCNPLDAVSTTGTINTSDLCAFTTYHAYDEANQLVETIEPSTSSATTGYVTAGATTTYTSDASGNQTTLVNPAGNTVTSTYDGADRLVGITYSDVSTPNCTVASVSYDTCFAYNADGTRSQMVDATGTTSYSYDDAGQLSSVTDSNGNTVTYGHDEFGHKDCVSYPGFSSSDSCINNPDNGSNTIDPGEVWYSYDSQGRLSTLVDWDGDAFTYAYDCTGDVAWLAETPSTQIPSVTACAGSSGSVPTSPAPTSSGTTYVVTTYTYSSGASGDLLTSQKTDAVTSSGLTSLLEFDSLSYDDNNNLTSSTPKVSGTTETADAYSYDSQQRVISGPETSGSKTAYSYVNSSGTQPFYSTNTIDEMGIDAMPDPGSTAQLGAEYEGNGELCWIGEVTSTTGSCGSPSAADYETMSYNGSGDLTGTTPTGYGSSSVLTWNVDSNEPTCINPSGTTCSGPSSGQPGAETYAYDADGLRMTTASWNGSSVDTTPFTWNPEASALLSNGAFDFLYGESATVPIAQVDSGDSDTGELVIDPSSNARGIVEVSSGAAHPDVLANYTDYDVYGNPISESGGTLKANGLSDSGISGDPDSLTSFGFGGGYEDATSLVYLTHRYYSPSLSQFLSVDPLVATSRAAFAYASDNSIAFADPLGLEDCGEGLEGCGLEGGETGEAEDDGGGFATEESAGGGCSCDSLYAPANSSASNPDWEIFDATDSAKIADPHAGDIALSNQEAADDANTFGPLSVDELKAKIAKQDYTLGEAEAKVVQEVGKDWVGEGARPIYEDHGEGRVVGWISEDGERVYRAPMYKDYETKDYQYWGWQANLVERDPTTGRALENMHINIWVKRPS